MIIFSKFTHIFRKIDLLTMTSGANDVWTYFFPKIVKLIGIIPKFHFFFFSKKINLKFAAVKKTQIHQIFPAAMICLPSKDFAQA